MTNFEYNVLRDAVLASVPHDPEQVAYMRAQEIGQEALAFVTETVKNGGWVEVEVYEGRVQGAVLVGANNEVVNHPLYDEDGGEGWRLCIRHIGPEDSEVYIEASHYLYEDEDDDDPVFAWDEVDFPSEWVRVARITV